MVKPFITFYLIRSLSFCLFHLTNGVIFLGFGKKSQITAKSQLRVACKVLLIKKRVPRKKATRKKNCKINFQLVR